VVLLGNIKKKKNGMIELYRNKGKGGRDAFLGLTTRGLGGRDSADRTHTKEREKMVRPNERAGAN